MRAVKVWLPVLLLSCAAVSAPVSALPEKYAPAPLSKLGQPARLVKLAPDAAGRFEAGEIEIRSAGTSEMPVYDLSVKGRTAYRLNQDGKYPYLGDIWTADLDGDGSQDFVIYASMMGNGLAPDNGVILLQIDPGVFRRLDLETYGFAPADFTDLDNDGKPEVILSSLYQDTGTDGKPHSFLVYAVYRIENDSLVRAGFGEAGFPSFVWFTEKANSKETAKLTDAQKAAYYASLPKVIASS